MSDGAKVVFGGLAALLALVLVGVLLHLTGVYVFGGVQRSTADYRGETSVIEKTRADGNYRIAAYEQFFDACAGIQAKQVNLQTWREQLKTMAPDDPRRWELEKTITGVEAALMSDIAQYNADAAKAGTRGQFRDSSLPYSIELGSEEVAACN